MEKMKGLGPKSHDMLRSAGIVSLDQLKSIGAVAAFCRVQQAGCTPSLNFLWGLESAITGEHWREVAKQHRTRLLLALEDMQRGRLP